MVKLNGLITALITPFTSKDEIDEEGLIKLISRQADAQVDGILILGTTGESATLTNNEKLKVIEIARHYCPSSIHLMVGTGSNSTTQAVEATAQAKHLGADSALIVTPYYNRPTQAGIYQHFKAINDCVDLPIMAYNIPSRTGQNINTSTLNKLAQLHNVIGIKESSGNIQQFMDIIETICPHNELFSVFAGDDALALPCIALGCVGVISVASNYIPKTIKEMIDAALLNNWDHARKLHYKLFPFFKYAFIETNPIPIKAIMSIQRLPAGTCRLPLGDLQSENLACLTGFLKEFEITD